RRPHSHTRPSTPSPRTPGGGGTSRKGARSATRRGTTPSCTPRPSSRGSPHSARRPSPIIRAASTPLPSTPSSASVPRRATIPGGASELELARDALSRGQNRPRELVHADADRRLGHPCVAEQQR